MRVIVCGGRDYADRDRVWQVLDGLSITFVAEGGAKGADRLAREWARARGVELETFNAQWKEEGRSAGIIRNVLMLKRSNPEVVVAFPGGRGTADMVSRARAAGVQVIEIDAVDGPPGWKSRTRR